MYDKIHYKKKKKRNPNSIRPFPCSLNGFASRHRCLKPCWFCVSHLPMSQRQKVEKSLTFDLNGNTERGFQDSCEFGDHACSVWPSSFSCSNRACRSGSLLDSGPSVTLLWAPHSRGEKLAFAKRFRHQLWNVKVERGHLIQSLQKA